MSGRWVDPRPAAVHLPGYPAWVQRRLERLNRAYVLQQGMANPDLVREAYSRLGGGSGVQVLPSHMEWIARAWLVAGPHLPAPSPGCVPGIVDALSLMQLESPLLEHWLIELAADQARLHGWDSLAAIKLSEDYLRGRRLRRYWEWLMGVVEGYRPDDVVLSPFETEVLSSRVIRWLFHGVGLRGLCRRSFKWQKSPPDIVAPLVRTGTGAWLPLLDDRIGTILDGTWVSHLQFRESLEIEGRQMRNCIGRFWGGVLARTFLVFSLWDPEEDRRATLGLLHVGEHGWHVAELRGPGNTQIDHGTRLAHVADKICRILGEVGDRHPLIAEYMYPGDEQARWRRMGAQTAQPWGLGRYIPRVGRTDPEEMLRRGWRAVLTCARQASFRSNRAYR